MESAIDFYWNDGVKQGIEQGIEQGEELTLVGLICKKLRKGKDVYQIADEVEEDVSRVKAICNVAEKFAPDYEVEKVLEALHADVMV